MTPGSSLGQGRTVEIPVGSTHILADLSVPSGPRGIVVFAHGSGSGRSSPRNRAVAGRLLGEGFATLLLDLLTVAESELDARTAELRFDIPRLSERLIAATDWRARGPPLADLPVGYFGASTGGAVALVAAAERSGRVGAVVLRGARSDLAGDACRRVRAPTLIIVGSEDLPVLRWNEATMALLPGLKRLSVVPGASHLFEEPGALAEVERMTVQWFRRHLPGPGSRHGAP